MTSKNNFGQTLLEYIVFIGIVTMALYVMGPAIKRGFQSTIKVTADQIGNQEDSDQTVNRPLDEDGRPLLPKDGEDSSYLVSSMSNAAVSGNRLVEDRLGVVTTTVDETTQSYTNSLTDQGFTAQ